MAELADAGGLNPSDPQVVRVRIPPRAPISQDFCGGPRDSDGLDGQWAFRVDAGFHADSGQRRQVLRQGFATKRAAEAALADMVGDAARATAVSTSTTKLGAYLDDWFATAKLSGRPRPTATSRRSSGCSNTSAPTGWRR